MMKKKKQKGTPKKQRLQRPHTTHTFRMEEQIPGGRRGANKQIR